MLNKSRKNISLKGILSKTTIVVLFLSIFVFAAFLRLYQIDKLSFWFDEAFSFSMGKMKIQNILWSRDPNMTFFNLLVHFWIKIIPEINEFTLRILAVFFSEAGILTVFLLSINITNKDENKKIILPATASFFAAINAFNIRYAQEFRGYSLMFLLSALSTLFLIKAIEYKKSKSFNCWYLCWATASVAGMYNHLFAFLIFGAQIFSLIILWCKSNLIKIKTILKPTIFILVLTFPLIIHCLGTGYKQINWLLLPDRKILLNSFTEMMGGSEAGIVVVYAILIGFGLLNIIQAYFKKGIKDCWKYVILINCLFLPILWSLSFSKIFMPIYLNKYLIIVLPFVFICASIGISSLATDFRKNKLIGFFALLNAVVYVFIISEMSFEGTKDYYEKYKKDDWRQASTFLSEKCGNPDDFYVYYETYSEPAVNFYKPNLKPKHNKEGDDVEKYLNDNYSKVCLISSHIKTYNEKNKLYLIENKLDRKFKTTIIKKFNGITIKVYE